MASAKTIPAPRKSLTAIELYTLAFGLFLGLAIIKFGNPVILEHVIFQPKSLSDFLHDAWPVRWANVLLVVLVVAGTAIAIIKKPRWPATRWLWILPLVWLGWQFLSASQSRHHDLTSLTLWQFGGCAASYFLGTWLIGSTPRWWLILPGILVAFAFCLVRAVDQKLFEFPSEKQFLLQSQSEGWTNMPPDVFQELKLENVIIKTNGVDIASPAIIAKYDKGRVNGTLVYPNALAGIVLLLMPIAAVAVWQITRNLRPTTCFAAMALITALGAAGLFWSGSKSGWLIALAMGVFWLYRLNGSRKLKWLVVIVLLVGGLAVFALRFQSYFAKGATSVGARFDYWRVAAHVTKENPIFGTGPGTFQRPYAEMKRPDAEMARLVHNDYLEQFSDSGFPGGLTYTAWLALLLWTLGKRVWPNRENWLPFALFTGILGWFLQGFIEFSLFVPALAWTAFTLAGCLLVQSPPTPNQVDKPTPPH